MLTSFFNVQPRTAGKERGASAAPAASAACAAPAAPKSAAAKAPGKSTGKAPGKPAGKPAGKAPGKPAGKPPSGKPKKTQAPEHAHAWMGGGVEYAKFEPLPPETNVPRPAESVGQPWQPLDGCDLPDDDVASWNGDTWGNAEDAEDDDADAVSAISDNLEYEPESLDTLDAVDAVQTAGASLSSSFDDATDVTLRSLFTRKSSSLSHSFAPHQALPVYTGPSLLLEDDSFD